VRKLEAALALNLRGEARRKLARVLVTKRRQRARLGDRRCKAQGARIDGAPAIVPQMLGASPTLDTRMRYENGGITVSLTRASTAHTCAPAQPVASSKAKPISRLKPARADRSISAALKLPALFDATGRLTGRISRPIAFYARGDVELQCRRRCR
jgi:hypothetical protein